MAASPTPRVEAIEPAMVQIPEGWFWMGCESGRDDEKPVHRVWTDAFDLAACQATNEDYSCFLAATCCRQPLHWNHPHFDHPKMPVVGVSWHDSLAYCDWLSRST